MKEKLTLEHIAPYLPYSLNATTKECGYKLPENGIITSWQGEGNLDEQIVITTGTGYYLSSVEKTIPILRPMDLTKPIIIDGNEVIPIVELAKIESRTMQNADKYTYGFEAFKRGLSFNSSVDAVRWYQYHTNKLEDNSDSSCFEMQIYSNTPLRFIKTNTYKPKYVGNSRYLNSLFNYQDILKWLYANKFDVDGLIEKGLAIDVDTLEINPYE